MAAQERRHLVIPVAPLAGCRVAVDAQDIVRDDVPQEDGRHLIWQATNREAKSAKVKKARHTPNMASNEQKIKVSQSKEATHHSK